MKYTFTPKQIRLLASLGLPFDFSEKLTPAQADQLDDAITHHLQTHGFENDGVNDVGLICESILDAMYDQEPK